MNVTIYVNSFIGMQRLIHIIYKIAKMKGKEEVYREMMKALTTIPETQIGKAKQIISHYASKLNIFIYDGNKPEPKEYNIIITKISGKGPFLMKFLSMLGYEIELDNAIYEFDGKRIIRIE